MSTMAVDDVFGANTSFIKAMISSISWRTTTIWVKMTGSSPPSIARHSSKLSRAVIWCGMLPGSVMSMWRTVASLLYFSGAMTSMENIGGTKAAPGRDSIFFAFLSEASGVLSFDPSERNEWPSFGNDRFMAVLAAPTSAAIEETDDASERRLAVRAADRTDGSELADDTEGDSFPGDCK